MTGPDRTQGVWYTSHNGDEVGPLARQDVVERIRSGELRRDDMVWTEGWPEWRRVDEVFRPPAPTSRSAPQIQGRATVRTSQSGEHHTPNGSPGTTRWRRPVIAASALVLFAAVAGWLFLRESDSEPPISELEAVALVEEYRSAAPVEEEPSQEELQAVAQEVGKAVANIWRVPEVGPPPQMVERRVAEAWKDIPQGTFQLSEEVKVDVDKSNRERYMLLPDTSARVIVAAFNSALAQHCQMELLVTSNYQTLRYREADLAGLTTEQAFFLMQLHLTTAVWVDGVLEKAASHKASEAECTPEHRAAVEERIAAYIDSGPRPPATAETTTP